VLVMSQHVCGVRAMQVARVTPLGGRNWPSVIFLDMLSCPLSFGVTRDILWWFDCCRWSFDPPFFSLFEHVMYTTVLFISYFSISVFVLFISYFVSFPFINVFILFNLVLQLQFLICLVFHFGPHLLKFLILFLTLLLKFIFF
jgi:hypothetical protein